MVFRFIHSPIHSFPHAEPKCLNARYGLELWHNNNSMVYTRGKEYNACIAGIMPYSNITSGQSRPAMNGETRMNLIDLINQEIAAVSQNIKEAEKSIAPLREQRRKLEVAKQTLGGGKERKPQKFLSDAEWQSVSQRYQAGETYVAIAKDIGIHPATIYNRNTKRKAKRKANQQAA